MVYHPLPAKQLFLSSAGGTEQGGKIKCRLKTNPELRNFLKIKPDLFAYGESETPSPLGLSVNGYACYVHKSKLTVIDNYRRGLAIFYLKKYQFLLTKVYSSKT